MCRALGLSALSYVKASGFELWEQAKTGFHRGAN